MSDDTKAAHDLFDFMNTVASDISKEYERIQKRAKDDPGTAGDQGEENWAEILRNWLPSSYKIVTKGRIIGSDGTVTPQVDVLVLSNAYPEKLLPKKLFLAGGVIAAFECKNTLIGSHIDKTIETCKKVKLVSDSLEGTPYRELQSPILFGLLAHSHSWQGGASKPIENIESKLLKKEAEIVQHPRELMDVLCVADLALWRVHKMIIAGTNMATNYPGAVGTTFPIFSKGASGSDNLPFTPVGSLIASLYDKLATQDQSIARMGMYFSKLGVSGVGKGRLRYWPASVFTKQTIKEINAGKLDFTPFTNSEWRNFID